MKTGFNQSGVGGAGAGRVVCEQLEDRRMLSASPFGRLTIVPQPLQGEVAGEALVNSRTSIGLGDVSLAMINGTNFNPTHTPTMIVHWGDGSKPLKVATQYVSPTEVSADISQVVAPAGTTPLQAHAYKRTGSFHIRVDLVDGEEKLAKFSETVKVAQNSPSGQTVIEKTGAQFTTPLGSFQPMPTVGAVSAQIDWGDGQRSTAALTNTGEGQAASVMGSHTYTRPGKYRVSITGLFEPIPLPGGGAAAFVAYQNMFSTVIVRHAKN